MNEREPQEGTTGSDGEVLLRAEGVHKDFHIGGRQIRVLKGIDLEIGPRETIGILGVSGVGKTTLLHILGTLDRPSRGRVLYRGEDLSGKSDKELARFRNRAIGFVFQFHYLLSDLTARENVMLPLLIGGVARRDAASRAQELLEELGLEDRMEHRPGALSGGERQRVAVARAVAMGPRIVLADEPTGNLDQDSARVVEDLLIRLRETHGVTLVAVTHNPRFAARMDRKFHMFDGRIEETGDAPPLSQGAGR